MSTKRLNGKVAIVTGAGSGFGAAIAKAYAREGASVLVCDISVDNGKAVAASSPDLLVFHEMDVTSASAWQSAIATTVERFGRVDILVNNAGTTYRNKPTAEVTEAEFQRVFDVNVKGVFLGCAEFMKHAISRGGGGSVINIASTGASRPRPGLVWYNASKGAVVNATKGLAAEYGPNKIRVNAVCPLLTSTALFSQFVGVEDTPENRKQFEAQVPMGRICEVEDVAGVCTFLASDEAKFVTGVSMKVDGGKCI